MESSILSWILIGGSIGLVCAVLGLAVLKLGRSPKRAQSPTPANNSRSKSEFVSTPVSSPVSRRVSTGISPHARAAITVMSGSLAGKQFRIPDQGIRIGRGLENEIVLSEPMVSRRHAEITLEGKHHILRDCGSSNGTFIEGVRIFERALRSGDHFQIGFSEFTYQMDDASVAPTPRDSSPQNVLISPLTATEHQEYEGYTIEESIGGGGMAEVYRARTRDGRSVAIKVPRIMNDTYLMKKFEREGNHIGAVLRGHPHIVEVERYAYTQSGVPYIVMEYVDGGSLRDRSRRKMEISEIRRIIAQTCLALGYAHRHQIVHRDIKPENILLTNRGQVKVADFGIARLLSVVTVTNKGPIGTPEYMSPEQITGDNVLPASDVYSVGVVMYELLTGRVPFPRRSEIQDDVKQAMDVVERHLHAPPPPLRAFNTNIPTDLEQITMRALAKDPRKRYQDGDEMASALGVKPDLPIAKPDLSTARLQIVQGPNHGRSLPLSSDLVEITRQTLDPTNSAISRCHARIHRRGEAFWLEDCSKNGTWVNNQRVAGEHLLSIGDQIRICNCVLRLEA